MLNPRKSAYILFLTSILLLSSCASSSVRRVDSDTQIDLTGDWNDTDVDIVCSSLIDECLSSPTLERFEIANGRLPLIVVGSFRNESDEHIDTSIITRKLQNAIIESGRADFMASNDQRQETREALMDQLAWSAADKAKTIANEDAADFMLQGSVNSIVQRSGRSSVRTYYVFAELIDIESGRIIWTGENDEIKKVVKQAAVRW